MSPKDALPVDISNVPRPVLVRLREIPPEITVPPLPAVKVSRSVLAPLNGPTWMVAGDVSASSPV